MTWRRALYLTVYVVTWVPLFLLFVCAYLSEGFVVQMERFDRWSLKEQQELPL
jgi:cytochrome c oxidase subunit IV